MLSRLLSSATHDVGEAISLSPDHFLALPRPTINVGPPAGTPDTSTLAAPDFDIDTRTGFMPPEPPLTRLPHQWEPWEAALEDGIARKLQLSDKPGITEADKNRAAKWQARVRAMPILSTAELRDSEILLRRAHHVLSWMMHLYIRTLPTTLPKIRIPPPITVPHLQVCALLQLPPVLTYSDDVLYNWALIKQVPMTVTSPAPDINNLRCLTLFTGTKDEEEFYLSSARIELKGVEALSLMRAIMDEAFVGDSIAVKRIASYLHCLSEVIGVLTNLLVSVRQGCDPLVFYNDIRPWFRGADSDAGRPWVFEGLELDPELKPPTELSGPSAGQSTLIHSLDVFLGVDKYSHASHITGKHDTIRSSATVAVVAAPAPSSDVPPLSSHLTPPPPSSSDQTTKPATSFLARMQVYMPRHHRAFLRHLASNPRPIRDLVESSNDAELKDGYNAAIQALKVFRDAHVRIVAIYIVGPSRRGGRPENETMGTGGTSAIRFVKSVRDQTKGALLPDVPPA